MTKISVIIPVYNTESYVEECLESVISQQGIDLECIIVDDASTDDSLTVIEQVRSDLEQPNVITIVRHQTNQGPSAARNSGLRVATGDWIFYLDSDDMLAPDSLSTLLHLADQGDSVDWVEGSFERRSAQRNWQTISPKGHYKSHAEIAQNYGSINLTNAANKLISRRIAEQHPFVEGLIFEDTMWCQTVYPALSNIVVTSTPTYIHRIRQGSIMQSQYTAAKVDSQMAIIEQIINSHPDRNQEQTATYLAMNLIKNLYSGNFTRLFRRSTMSRLKATGVYTLSIDRSSLPPFSRLLSLNFGCPLHGYYRFLCSLYTLYRP